MKKIILPTVILALVAAAALWYAYAPREAADQLTPAQVKQMDWRQLSKLSVKCEAGELDEDLCTLAMEVFALKAQHAKQGERYWVERMLQLGRWYNRVGTPDWQPGGEVPKEVEKAKDVYEWLLSNKPFHSERVLLEYARLYDSPYGETWAEAHRDEAKDLYTQLQEKHPNSEYAAEVTAVLQKLQ